MKDHDVVMLKPVGRIRNNVSYILESWMEDIFNENCEKLPNKEVSDLPDNFSKLKVWKILKSKFQIFYLCANVTYRFSCKIWEKQFSFVKIQDHS
jgi:hypothetical protein